MGDSVLFDHNRIDIHLCAWCELGFHSTRRHQTPDLHEGLRVFLCPVAGNWKPAPRQVSGVAPDSPSIES